MFRNLGTLSVADIHTKRAHPNYSLCHIQINPTSSHLAGLTRFTLVVSELCMYGLLY